MTIKNPVTIPLLKSRQRKLKANKQLQVVTGRLLTLAYERGELREILDILKAAEEIDMKDWNEAVLKAKTVGQATPTNVLEALDVIRDYLTSGGWIQAIINVEGGVSFRLTDIHEDYLQQLKSDDQRRA